jgi:tetraacyldisaccharide 4'-kinase
MSGLDAWVCRWWAGEAGAAGWAVSVLAAPLELGFRAGVGLRDRGFAGGWMRTEAVPVPVVSVGNLAVGGAGKTPFTGWLARRLADGGRRPAIVMRGYGADEVSLHREWNPDVPVFTSARRVDGARRAAAAGCDVVVLDDGFQHRRLRRELDVVLVAAESWTRTPRLLPRGPWREPPRALGRAGIVVVTRKSASAERAVEVEAGIRALRPGTPTARCAILPSRVVSLDGAREMPVEALRGRPVLAVAALADPAPFLHHLRHAEVEAATYPDHHPFDGRDVEAIARRAAGRTILMTAKDAVKLRTHLPITADAWVLEQRLEMESAGEALDAALRLALAEGGR